jgi:acyl-CoA thioesterase
MTTFADDTAVQPDPTHPDEFTATIRRNFWIVVGPNGGYVAAIFLRAMTARLGDEAATRTPRSFTVHYLDPPTEGEVRVRTRIERQGRALSTVTARMIQADRTVAIAVAAFSKPRPSLEFNDLRMPDVPPPGELHQRPFDPAVMPPMAGQIAVWHALGALPLSGEDEPLTGGWFRLADPEPLTYPQLALLADAWMPAVFNRMTAIGGAPTIDLTIHFRDPIPTDPPPPPDDVYLGVFRTNVGTEGFVEMDGEIWASDGRLLVQCRQLQLALMP